MGKFFKLKSGSHVTGTLEDMRIYKSNDPMGSESLGNIVESDEDLAKIEPTRWEEYTGPIPDRLRKSARGVNTGSPFTPLTRSQIAGEPPPPGPTSDIQLAEAADMTASLRMSPEELEKHAEALIERAEALKQRANQARDAQEQNDQKSRELQAQRRTTSQADESDDEGENPTVTSSRQVQGKIPSNLPSVAGQKAPTNEKEYHAVIDKMSLEDLKTHAKERKIDLKGAVRREDVVKMIKASKD